MKGQENITISLMKAHHYYLRRLKRANLSQKLMMNFYKWFLESCLTNCTRAEQMALQWVIQTIHHTIEN